MLLRLGIRFAYKPNSIIFRKLSQGPQAANVAEPESAHALSEAVCQIQKYEQSLSENFEKSDLNSLVAAFQDMHLRAREHFADNPFWKLFWNSDYFIRELEQVLEENNLIKVEYQVGFSNS
jgi:hypothetical protein